MVLHVGRLVCELELSVPSRDERSGLGRVGRSRRTIKRAKWIWAEGSLHTDSFCRSGILAFVLVLDKVVLVFLDAISPNIGQ